MNDQDRFHHEVMSELEREGIVTTNTRPPVPFRHCDWQAYRKGAEPGDLVGFGATEQEAIEDLIEQEQA